MAKLLWAKGDSIDQVMQELTVGNDHLMDKDMVVWDCIGSAAHARMLHSIGIISKEETTALLKELKNIYHLGRERKVEIPVELEDVHNVIENLLVEKIGDEASKIHAGRSRNDQVLVTTRLYLRYTLLDWLHKLIDFSTDLFNRYDDLKDIYMPGYTHMQPAMPSSVCMWLHSFIEGALTLVREGVMLMDIINTNPLGASAGFGSNIKLDRELTTKLMAFSRVQRSPIDCNNSRGKFEEKVLRFGADIAGLFEKLACDMMLYTTREFNYFSLPVGMTTGSSIMPQKKNYDIAELLRGRGAKVRGAANELALITAKLTSSYNREFQYTKEPLIRGAFELGEMFRMASLIISNLKANKERLAEVMDSYDDLYSTYEANRAAESGMPYRQAYRMVADKIKNGDYDKKELAGDFEIVKEQAHKYVGEAKADFESLKKQVILWEDKFSEAEREVFNF